MRWILLLGYISSVGVGSTGVGSGGDSVERYLEGTRMILKSVMTSVENSLDTTSLCNCQTNDPDFICQYLKSLNADQRRYCQRFLVAAAPQVLALNEDPKTPFEITDKTIYVSDSTGKKRPVVAATALGTEGGILFNYQRVTQLWPVGLLAVMGHEFGHKVEYGGFGKFVDDHWKFPPFNFPDGGRALLDAFGAAIAQHAKDTHRVPIYTGTEDRFSCEIEDSRSGTGPYFSGTSPRFYQDASMNAFDVGIGIFPKDLQCHYKEAAATSSYLSFRVRIHEEIGCEKPTSVPSQRFTELSLWRVFERPDRMKTPELVQLETYPGKNPVCGDDVPLEITASVPHGALRFRGAHLGAAGRGLPN